MFGVPFIAVKAVTDIVDGDVPTADEFMANLGCAAKALQARMWVLCDCRGGMSTRI